ncbi:MAG: hypothetical protein WDM80_15685 [Limisphaerales bacterium]
MDYQAGITYERLLQPQKAVDTYSQILTHEMAAGTNATPGLKAVFEVSRWRIGFLGWQSKAEADIHAFADSTIVNPLPETNIPSETITQ